MKQPFRFHRGEFNGRYIKALSECANLVLGEYYNEMVYNALFHWKAPEEVTANELPIRTDDIVNLGRFAGIFAGMVYASINVGSVRFTEKHYVNNVSRGERGLFKMEGETFVFPRDAYDDYPDDIVTEASNAQRSTFVPHGTTPVGYVAYGMPLYNEDGTIIYQNILPTPPTDGTPYITYYGENFLKFEYLYNNETSAVDPYVFKRLIECVQRIRFDGPSIARLLEITEILGEGYIKDLEIFPQDRYSICYYRVDANLAIDRKEQRLSAWRYVCEMKFKHIIFLESSIRDGVIDYDGNWLLDWVDDYIQG